MCTRFSCNLIKWCSELAKITILSIHPLYPISSSPTGWTIWPINGVYIKKLNLPQILPCQYIHVFINPINVTQAIINESKVFEQNSKFIVLKSIYIEIREAGVKNRLIIKMGMIHPQKKHKSQRKYRVNFLTALSGLKGAIDCKLKRSKRLCTRSFIR